MQVEVLDMKAADWGWTGVRRGFGLLADDPLLPGVLTRDSN